MRARAAAPNPLTATEKAALIKGASQLLLDVLNKPLEATFVVIDEIDPGNWGWGGLPVLQYRKKLAVEHSATVASYAQLRAFAILQDGKPSPSPIAWIDFIDDDEV